MKIWGLTPLLFLAFFLFYNSSRFDCTLENLPPFVNVNVLPLGTVYCRAFMDSTSGKVRITPGKSLADSIAKEILCMEDLLEISCGLDVRKEKIVACIPTGPLGKPTHSEIREFTALVPDMVALRDWIVFQNCHHAAMESAGIYWMPIYEILEDAFSGGITLLVVNARHMKNVPGKKTDMRDSEWIFALLRARSLNGSFIPEKKITGVP